MAQQDVVEAVIGPETGKELRQRQHRAAAFLHWWFCEADNFLAGNFPQVCLCLTAGDSLKLSLEGSLKVQFPDTIMLTQSFRCGGQILTMTWP